MIVGGTTTSSDFGPNSDSSGYLYALDHSANWFWGSYYTQNESSLSDISGCSMNKEGSKLIVLAQSQTVPVLLEVNTVDGSVNGYLAIESNFHTSGTSYILNSAIYSESTGVRSDYFAAFVMYDYLYLMKLQNTAGIVTIDWNYEFVFKATIRGEHTIQPLMMFDDSLDESVIYLAGSYDESGSLMQFRKEDAQLTWFARFEDMTIVRGFASEKSGDHLMYLCGDNELETSTSSSVLRIDNAG